VRILAYLEVGLESLNWHRHWPKDGRNLQIAPKFDGIQGAVATAGPVLAQCTSSTTRERCGLNVGLATGFGTGQVFTAHERQRVKRTSVCFGLTVTWGNWFALAARHWSLLEPVKNVVAWLTWRQPIVCQQG